MASAEFNIVSALEELAAQEITPGLLKILKQVTRTRNGVADFIEHDRERFVGILTQLAKEKKHTGLLVELLTSAGVVKELYADDYLQFVEKNLKPDQIARIFSSKNCIYEITSDDIHGDDDFGAFQGDRALRIVGLLGHLNASQVYVVLSTSTVLKGILHSDERACDTLLKVMKEKLTSDQVGEILLTEEGQEFLLSKLDKKKALKFLEEHANIEQVARMLSFSDVMKHVADDQEMKLLELMEERMAPDQIAQILCSAKADSFEPQYDKIERKREHHTIALLNLMGTWETPLIIKTLSETKLLDKLRGANYREISKNCMAAASELLNKLQPSEILQALPRAKITFSSKGAMLRYRSFSEPVSLGAKEHPLLALTLA